MRKMICSKEFYTKGSRSSSISLVLFHRLVFGMVEVIRSKLKYWKRSSKKRKDSGGFLGRKQMQCKCDNYKKRFENALRRNYSSKELYSSKEDSKFKKYFTSTTMSNSMSNSGKSGTGRSVIIYWFWSKWRY